MAAPARGRRPPDSGPDVSLYDHCHPPPDSHRPSPPDSDSGGSAIHGSASDRPDRPDSPPNGLPSVSGMFDIKSEPNGDHDESTADAPQENSMRRQSAASALLAQLLGGQASGVDGSGQPVRQSREGHSTGATRDSHAASNIQLQDESTDLPGDQSQIPAPDYIRGPDPNGNEPLEEHYSGKGEGGSALPDADTVEGLSDPLISRSSLDQSNAFAPPFDITAAPRTPFQALQQNEILTAAYLSQGADLPALGYSHGAFNPDGTGPIEGSEPRIQAFAKLEFDDGHFYVNTYSFILGRDVRAARAAHQREVQARQAVRNSKTKSSSGGKSHTPVRTRNDPNGVIGSVVSDRGGIMGFDPDVPAHAPPQLSRKSSNSSGEGPVHATPAELHTTDYNALAMQSLNDGSGEVKPVDTLALLPSPQACPTIPIHPPTTVDGNAAGHRGISRKHVKIAYNFGKDQFEMEVLGRNGAFIGADFLSLGQIRPLHNGDYIQIGGVRIRFLLPDVPVGETGADTVEEPYMEEDQNAQASVEAEDDVDSAGRRGSDIPESKDKSKVAKILLKTKGTDPTRPMPSIEGSTDPSQPATRRRGPGRPPKDGIMSKRERAELAREQKLAAKREANGGVTPPPNRAKGGKVKEEAVAESPGPKPEKRKYAKRKKADGTPSETLLPSVEGVHMRLEQRSEDYIKAPPVKKRKPSRSPSPNYPPESAYAPEDLAKPPYNYAVLIFDALTDTGTPMTLKQIYRALKLKYPYFRFKCETEGWTSSVRHNLNGNGHLFMHAERDGKGWSWQLRPGASVEKEKKRRPSPPPPSSQPPSTPSGYMPALGQGYNPPGGQTNMASQHFQFSTMSSNPYPDPAPQHSSPYPTPSQAPAPFPIPSPIRNNLPAAFAQTTPSTYTSPYASDPPPQLAQFQTQNIPQEQPQRSYYQQHPALPANNNSASQNLAPNPGPPAPQQTKSNATAIDPGSRPAGNSEAPSFNERANKAIDDFEAVLMEDYDDKNYIREVLRSARARALGQATESSFPGGEPKDEAVILDALKNLVGNLKDG